jgi:excisionase family DNA binding protein
LLRAIVAELQAEIAMDDRLAYAEKDAAALLGVPRHVLRDARLRGEVRAVKLGKSWRYSRANLLRYLDGVKPPNS